MIDLNIGFKVRTITRFQIIFAAAQNILIVTIEIYPVSIDRLTCTANKQFPFPARHAAGQPLIKGDLGAFLMVADAGMLSTAEAVRRVPVLRQRRGWQQRQAQGQRHKTA